METSATYQNTSWAKVAVFLLLGFSLLFFLYQLSDILKLVVISSLLAYLFDPFATSLESYGLSRTLATIVIFAVCSLIIGFISFFLVPIAVQQVSMLKTGQLIEQIDLVVADLQQMLEGPLSSVGIVDLDLKSSLQTNLSEFLSDSINYFPNVLSTAGNLVIVPFMMFFFIKDARSMKKGFIDIVPNKYFEFSLNVLQKMDAQLGNYLRGQFLVASIVGSLSTLILWWLDVDFFMFIGPLAGLANMIPYVGPIAGGLLAIIASVITTGGFDTIPSIVVAFALIQMIDNSLLQPLILARNVELHPMLILLAILIGGKLFGVVGLLLAVPFTAIVKVIVVETLVNLRRYHI
ncbi:MAG: AI-2E family transporter [Rhodothermales bacterium]